MRATDAVVGRVLTLFSREKRHFLWPVLLQIVRYKNFL